MKKSDRTKSIILLLAGIVFIFAAFFVPVKTAVFRKNGVKTKAEIVRIASIANNDGSNDKEVYVRYSADGKEYTGQLGYYSISMKVGDKIDIIYIKDNPEKIAPAKTSVFLYIVFLIAGGACVAVGIIRFVGSKNKNSD